MFVSSHPALFSGCRGSGTPLLAHRPPFHLFLHDHMPLMIILPQFFPAVLKQPAPYHRLLYIPRRCSHPICFLSCFQRVSMTGTWNRLFIISARVFLSRAVVETFFFPIPPPLRRNSAFGAPIFRYFPFVAVQSLRRGVSRRGVFFLPHGKRNDGQRNSVSTTLFSGAPFSFFFHLTREPCTLHPSPSLVTSSPTERAAPRVFCLRS